MNTSEKAKDEKVNLRRLQILVAARKCIIQHGFHATTMSQISDLSGLSVGVIYRYFSNKEELINEIVKEIVNKRLKMITALNIDLIEMSDMLTDRLGMQRLDSDFVTDNILMFEVLAEVRRNEHVAAIFKDADVRMSDVLLSKFMAFQPKKNLDIVKAQVEIMMELFYGSDIRSFVKREMNDERLRELHDDVLSSLFKVKIKRK
ncbi:helix-turn-helix domain-containing protein [Acerihabitans sp. TG2]|uniref:TetR/AcrR family transcriptional regulator n=1 Tax=Acerihabitans sp. TG2 TaxID=3096008 RepID=UPI002B23E263|nr:helix-turn-helix domain-containing protein [Acerihabitans sp. TG2]MEA9390246.1 helix-turn-helix domain-containing protein [Acerihabitans sp. TG2]